MNTNTLHPGIIFGGMMAVGIAIGSLALFVTIDSDSKVVNSQGTTHSESSLQAEKKEVEAVKAEDKPTQEDLEKLALKAIDEIAHPDDPQNPPGIKGLTDEELVELSADEVAELIEMALPYAEQKSSESRYLFALGRAEWIHGDEATAAELLLKAAKNGSAAAYAYLARMTDDLEQSADYLRRAIDGGFLPAREWLTEVEQAIAEEQQQIVAMQQVQQKESQPLDFSKFSLPPLMEAFYKGETSGFAQEPLLYLAYIIAVNDALNEQTMLFMVEKPKEYLRELNPNLSFEASKKIATSQVAVNQTTTAGLNIFKNMIIAMGQARRSGASISQEVAAVNRAMYGGGQGSGDPNASYVTLIEMKDYGAKDGRVLGLFFDEHPDVFRKIYQNMHHFVRKEVK